VNRDTLARHSLITPMRWRDSEGVAELDTMTAITLRQIAPANILREKAMDVIRTNRHTGAECDVCCVRVELGVGSGHFPKHAQAGLFISSKLSSAIYILQSTANSKHNCTIEL
jgi:hypothetical protein